MCQRSRVVDCVSIPLQGLGSRLRTRMKTIEELVEANIISRIQVEMHQCDQELRLLYGTPAFIVWLGELAKGTGPERRLGEATAAEQVDDLINTFLSGRPLVYMRQFRSIRAEKNAVWELKTPDVRIFGWFLKKDCFVGVFGNWTDVVKDHDLYRGYRIAIRRMRRELGVDETLCVQGVTPGDVLSL